MGYLKYWEKKKCIIMPWIADNDNDSLFKMKSIEWLSIQSVDEFGGQFSIEIDQTSNKLLLLSNKNGIARIQFPDFDTKKKQYVQNDIELNWLYICSEQQQQNGLFYISTHSNNHALTASNSEALFLF